MKKLFKTYFEIPIQVYVYCEDNPGEVLKVVEKKRQEILEEANEVFRNAFKSFSSIEIVMNKGMISDKWKNRKPYSFHDEERECSQIFEEEIKEETKEETNQMTLTL